MKRRKPLRRTNPMPRQRTRLPRRNRARLARIRAEQFGPQAQLCRESHCCACGCPPPSDPAHVVSRGAGGKDSDTVPLCRTCHDAQHREGIRTFQAKRGICLPEIARAMARAVRGQA